MTRSASTSHRKARLVASTALSVLTFATLGAGAAAAQVVAAEAVEEVVVTGSRIARKDYVSNSPIVTLPAQQIEAAGAVTVEAALNQMPQFTASASSNTNLPPNGGRATLNLRGLGSSRTLVLLDGRRLPPAEHFSGAIDVNQIPNALVENVEVITGGASAVYGSDAVSGVVNFKLRRNFTGLELDAQYGVTEQGDGETVSVSATLGGIFADDRGRGAISLTYADRNPVFGADRRFFEISGLSSIIPQGVYLPTASNLPGQAALDQVFGAYGVAAGTVRRTAFRLGFNPDGSLFNQSGPLTNYRSVANDYIINTGTGIFANSGQVQYIQIPLERYSAFGHAEYEIAEGLRAYGQVNFTIYEAATNVDAAAAGSSAPGFSVPVSNPFIPADLRTVLASRPTPGAPFTLAKRLSEVGQRFLTVDNTAYQVVLGLRGEVPGRDWTWDVYGSHGQTKLDETTTGYASRSAVQQLLEAPDGGASRCAGGYNPFGLTTLSPACVAFMTRTVKNDTTMKLSVVEAILQGKLVDVPAGELRFALGADYRRDTFEFLADAQATTGDIISYPVIGNGAGVNEVYELYGELLAPLLRDLPMAQELNLSLGYRFSDYRVGGSVSTYKIDGDWRLNEWLRMRGGFHRAIRVPTVGALFASPTQAAADIGTTATGAGDPCDVSGIYRRPGAPNAAAARALCIAQGVPGALVDSYTLASRIIFAEVIGNPTLEAEKADTYSVGLVWRSPFDTPLLSRLTGSIDYYSIEIDKALGSAAPSLILARCFNATGENPGFSQANFYCGLITRDPNSGQLLGTGQPLLNLGAYKSSGVDLQVDWSAGLEAFGLDGRYGEVGLNFVASYVGSYRIQTLPGEPFRDFAGTIGNGQIDSFSVSHPEWKLTTSLFYTAGPLRLAFRWRFIDAMADSSTVTNAASTVPGTNAYSLFDLEGRWNIKHGLELRLGVNNLADKDPPRVFGAPGVTDPSTFDILGRRVYAGLKARF